MCRGQYSTLVLLQGSSKVAVGLFFFLHFVSFGSRIYPNCTCRQLYLVPTVSLYFVDLGEVCPGASIEALQQKVPDSRPVSK